MLLARSNASKNSNKRFTISAFSAGSAIIAPNAIAQATGTDLNASGTWLSVFLSLILVVAVILVLAALLRRFSPLHSTSSHIKPVASMMVGTRERIAVIQVGDEQHLIGVTSHNINHLAKLEQNIELGDHKAIQFKDKLNSFINLQKKGSKSDG